MSLPLRFLSVDANTKHLDSKQKKYQQAVEKALSNFDAVTEWADYISCLGKLLKALQSWSPKFQNVKYFVPYPYQVSRRLASSLSPNLPSGVHQKTIEVYSFIFEKIGSETLGKEINIWIGGILPLMTYASISIKTSLIELYENYIVGLPSETLKILVKALLASLFPGIDDESSEFQAITFGLLDSLRENLNDESLFWQSCFIVIINNKERRLGGLTWLTKRLPSLNAVPHLTAKEKDTDLSKMDAKEVKEHGLSLLLEQSRAVVSPEPGLLIRAFSRCLEDDNEILIQRGILDLLLQRLHLHSPVLQLLVKPSDCKLLIIQACKTLLKRDMSLNRRIWNWLLGPIVDNQTGEQSDSQYFVKNGLQNLLNGLYEMLETPEDCINAFKIVSALMDRWQIASYLTPQLFIPLMKKSKVYLEETSVRKTASAFFDSVETNIIWGKTFHEVFILKNYGFLKHILQNFNCATDEEIAVRHLPLVFISLICQDPSETSDFFEICEILVNMIPERAYLPIRHSSMSCRSEIDYNDILEKIKVFYVSASDPIKSKELELTSDFETPFKIVDLTYFLCHRTHQLLIHSIRNYENVNEFAQLFSQIIEIIPEKIQSPNEASASNWSDVELINSIFECKVSIERKPNEAIVGIIEIFTKYLYDSVPILESMQLLKIIMTSLWDLLKDHLSQVEAVKLLETLVRYIPHPRIESTLSSLFLAEESIIARLTVLDCLWSNFDDLKILERPLALTFDELVDEKNSNYWYVYKWVTSVIESGSGGKLFKLLVTNILQFNFIKNDKIGCMDDLDILSYHLDTLKNILRSADSSVYKAFSAQLTSLKPSDSEKWKGQDVSTYKSFTIAILLRFLSVDNEDPGTSIKSCLALLSLLVDGTESNFKDIVSKLLQISTHYISKQSNDSQIIVVSLLHIISQVLALSHKRQISLDIFKDDSSQMKYVEFLVTTVSNVEGEIVLNSYGRLLSESIIYFQNSIVKIILPLCTSISDCIKKMYCDPNDRGQNLRSISVLLLSLEELLEVSHGYLRADESSGYFLNAGSKNDFLQNMVSNVFSSDHSGAESKMQNERSVVSQAFRTVTETALDIWFWAYKETNHLISNDILKHQLSKHETASKYKDISSRLMEKLFFLDRLEVLRSIILKNDVESAYFLNKMLDQKKNDSSIPHLLNAFMTGCKESSSTSLLPGHKVKKASSPSSSVSVADPVSVISYTFSYVECSDNSVVEEFYNDFLIFVKDIATNYSTYMPFHISILKFVALVTEKIDYSSIGQERRVKKEVSEYFVKILNNALAIDVHDVSKQGEIFSTLIYVVERLPYACNETKQGDRFNSCLSSIVNYSILPFAKNLENISTSVLRLIRTLAPIGEKVKNWKQLIYDVFNDPKYLPTVVKSDVATWNYVFYHWACYTENRERLFPDLILAVNAKANVITPSINPFNSWSESEAVSKSNNILRLAYLLLISPSNQHQVQCQLLMNIVEQLLFEGDQLLQATSFILLRTMWVKFSSSHFIDHWPMLFSALQSIFLGIYEASQSQQEVDVDLALQAAKTLDLLLTLNFEEFSSTTEWIFIIDTINSIYKKDPYVALADEISQCKEFSMSTTTGVTLYENELFRAPLLVGVQSITDYKELVPFFFNVSYSHYEAMYNLKPSNQKLYCDDILADLCASLGHI